MLSIDYSQMHITKELAEPWYCSDRPHTSKQCLALTMEVSSVESKCSCKRLPGWETFFIRSVAWLKDYICWKTSDCWLPVINCHVQSCFVKNHQVFAVAFLLKPSSINWRLTGRELWMLNTGQSSSIFNLLSSQAHVVQCHFWPWQTQC